ncbi:MAG: patatin-like phospholipase family protein [Candidatus Rickettsia vulgarisii]
MSKNTQKWCNFSGGGTKAFLAFPVLKEMEKSFQEEYGRSVPLAEVFNGGFTATSVGGLLAGLLAIPKSEGSKEPRYSVKEVEEIFSTELNNVFAKSHWLWGIFGPKYDEASFEKLLDKYCGDIRLSETVTRLMITVTDRNTNESKIFDSFDSYSCHIKLKDVIRATTSAPTYFKPVYSSEAVPGYDYAAGTPYNYVDGGLAANRPGALALLKLKEDIVKKIENENPELSPKELSTIIRAEQLKLIENTTMCSINFETTKTNTFFNKMGNGILGFLLGDGIDSIIEANQTNSTHELETDLREGFMPIFLPVPKGCEKLDNVSKSNIAKLKAAGEQWIVENKQLIQEICGKLSVSMTDKIQEEKENKKNLDLLTNNDFEKDNNLQEFHSEADSRIVPNNSNFNGIEDIIAVIKKSWQSEVNREELLVTIYNNLPKELIQQIWERLDSEFSNELKNFIIDNGNDLEKWEELLFTNNSNRNSLNCLEEVVELEGTDDDRNYGQHIECN